MVGRKDLEGRITRGEGILPIDKRRPFDIRKNAYVTCGRNSAVECHLAKVDVDGSNPFARSRNSGGIAKWLRQRSAKPPSPVRFRSSPPFCCKRKKPAVAGVFFVQAGFVTRKRQIQSAFQYDSGQTVSFSFLCPVAEGLGIVSDKSPFLRRSVNCLWSGLVDAGRNTLGANHPFYVR